jgi:hypothetical protein
MALIVLSNSLEVVNTTIIRPQQRSFAASAGSLRADLLNGWLIRSLRPIRLIHAHTRMRKSAALNESPPRVLRPEFSSGDEQTVEESIDDKRIDVLVEQVIHLSRKWNVRQFDDVHEEPAHDAGKIRIPPRSKPSVALLRRLRQSNEKSTADLQPVAAGADPEIAAQAPKIHRA